jgi:hypothetical protein
MEVLSSICRILALSLSICDRIILEWFLNKYDIRVDTRVIWHRLLSIVGHINEPMGCVKGREFVDWLSD